MLERILQLLKSEGIGIAAPVPLSDCIIKKPYLLEREGLVGTGGTVIIMAVPYFTPECEGATVSAYAVSRDYHLFFRELFERILPVLRYEFRGTRFCGFADHSPVDELHAAARAGLGVVGKNGLLITREHSSYVFLGEIVCDATIPCELSEIRTCFNCRACLRECPMTDTLPCLSALTQKKGELTEEESEYIRRHGCAWGCDICQKVCPYTAQAAKNGTLYTKIPFFLENTLPSPTRALIEAMSDEEFASRAYSWRGRQCILRNLKLLEHS